MPKTGNASAASVRDAAARNVRQLWARRTSFQPLAGFAAYSKPSFSAVVRRPVDDAKRAKSPFVTGAASIVNGCRLTGRGASSARSFAEQRRLE